MPGRRVDDQGGGAAARRLQRQAVGGDLPPRRLLGRERPSSSIPAALSSSRRVRSSRSRRMASAHPSTSSAPTRIPAPPKTSWQRGAIGRDHGTPQTPSPRRAGDRILHRSTGTRAPPTPGTTPRASRGTRAPAAGRSGTAELLDRPRHGAIGRPGSAGQHEDGVVSARQPPWRAPPRSVRWFLWGLVIAG